MKSKQPLRKRLLALLLTLGVTLGLLPLGGVAIAAGTTDIWDGTTATAFAGGDGSEENPYQIATGAQLSYLREQVNGGEKYDGKYFKLTTNLNLNDMNWLPIGGDTNTPFQGSLDGQNHMISNLNISSGAHLGLFGVFKGKFIQNLNIQNVKINSITAEAVGALAGTIYSMEKIENCHARYVHVTSTKTGVGTINGGLVGLQYRGISNTTRYLNCSVRDVAINQTKSDGTAISGGLVGWVYAHQKGDTFLVENCLVEGAITVTNTGGSAIARAGGLFGYIYNGTYNDTPEGGIESEKLADFVIRGCQTDVSIEAPGLEIAGGLIGECALLTIEDCHSSGAIHGGNATGGLAGFGSVIEIENCSASGDITGTWSVGGLVGDGIANTYKDSHATGDVTASDWHVGGLVGYGPKSKLEHCFATGNVESTATWDNRLGGLLGNAYDSTVTNCFATGEVTGVKAVGGLAGWTSNSKSTADGKGTFTNCFSFGKVEATETSDKVIAVPLVYGSWDGDVTVSNSYYCLDPAASAENLPENPVRSCKTKRWRNSRTARCWSFWAAPLCKSTARSVPPCPWSGAACPEPFKAGYTTGFQKAAR